MLSLLLFAYLFDALQHTINVSMSSNAAIRVEVDHAPLSWISHHLSLSCHEHKHRPPAHL